LRQHLTSGCYSRPQTGVTAPSECVTAPLPRTTRAVEKSLSWTSLWLRPDYMDCVPMKLRLTLVFLVFLAAGNASASNDRRECKEELQKLKAAFDTNYSSQNHHGYRRAKASSDNEEYRKCASQARKARERIERDADL